MMKDKKIFVLTSVLLITTFMELYSQVDARIKLNSADGSTRFEIRNSNDITKMSVDSNGNVIIEGSCTVKGTAGMSVNGNLQIKGNNILDSAGTARITLGDTSTYASTVTVRGLTVQGDLIIGRGRLSDGSIVSADIGDRQVTSAKLCISTAQVYGSDWAGTATWNVYESQSVTVTTAPAVIIAMVTCVANTWDNTISKFRITIGGIQVVANQVKPDDERTDGSYAGDLPVALVGMRYVTEPGNYTIQFEGTNQNSQVGNRSLIAFWVGAP